MEFPIHIEGAKKLKKLLKVIDGHEDHQLGFTFGGTKSNQITWAGFYCVTCDQPLLGVENTEGDVY